VSFCILFASDFIKNLLSIIFKFNVFDYFYIQTKPIKLNLFMITPVRAFSILLAYFYVSLSFAQDCNLSQLTVRQNPCVGSSFSVNYDFTFSNTTSSQYRLLVEGNEIGVFPYHIRNQTVVLEGTVARNVVLRVEDSQDPNCFATVNFEFLGCNPGDCALQISGIDPGSCSGDGTFDLDFTLNYQGVPDPSFNLYSNGIYIGKRSIVSGEEVSLLNFIKSWNEENTETLTVSVEDFPACSQSVTFDSDLVSCAGCNVYNMEVEVFNCGGGQFFATINFEKQGGAASFFLGGNGTTYGNFSYDDLPVTVGPLNATPSISYEFIVFDGSNPLCFTFYDLGVVVCNDPLCLVEDLREVSRKCTESDTYDLTIDFEGQGSPNGEYEVSVNGTLVASIVLDDLPYTLVGLPTEGMGIDEITVCAAGDVGCCASISVEKPNCVCEITNFSVLSTGCEDSETEYFASFSFSATEGAGETFTLFVNGIPRDITVSSSSFTLNNLPIAGGVEDEFRLCSQLDPSCCSVIVLEKPDCTPPCSIDAVTVEAGECDGILFTASVQVSYSGNPSDILVIEVNGEVKGAFPAFVFPINVGELAGDGVTEHDFTISVLGSNCQGNFILDPVNCSSSIKGGYIPGTLESRYYAGNLWLDFSLNQGQKVHCYLTDIRGRRIYAQENLVLAGQGTVQLYAGELIKGIYFLTIHSDQFMYVNKFLAN
jgi:hypothetical protein